MDNNSSIRPVFYTLLAVLNSTLPKITTYFLVTSFSSIYVQSTIKIYDQFKQLQLARIFLVKLPLPMRPPPLSFQGIK